MAQPTDFNPHDPTSGTPALAAIPLMNPSCAVDQSHQIIFVYSLDVRLKRGTDVIYTVAHWSREKLKNRWLEGA